MTGLYLIAVVAIVCFTGALVRMLRAEMVVRDNHHARQRRGRL